MSLAHHHDDVGMTTPTATPAPEQIGWFSRVAHETARLAGKPAAFLIATGLSESAGSRRPITG
jgi:hypothetical protein